MAAAGRSYYYFTVGIEIGDKQKALCRSKSNGMLSPELGICVIRPVFVLNHSLDAAHSLHGLSSV